MSQTYYFDIDFKDGSPRQRVEYNVTTHEQAKKLFQAQYGFDPCKSGAGRAFGLRVDNYGSSGSSEKLDVKEFLKKEGYISNDSEKDNYKNNSADYTAAGMAVAGAAVGVTGWALKKGWDAISNRPEPGSVASGSYRNYHYRYGMKTGDWSGYEKCVKEEREAGLAVAKWTGIGLGGLVAIVLWEVTLPLAIVGGGGYYFFKKNQTKNNPPKVQEKYRKESIK